MEALLYVHLDQELIQCNACHHRCIIANGKRGICGVRENLNGILIPLTYGYTAAIQIDPIEKKPIYEYLPGTKTYSLSTVGCNMKCLWCQNYSISQQPKTKNPIYGEYISPELHIQQALLYNVPSISYTYTEPTVFIEYALDIMKLAHTNGIQNIWVSNGYMTPESITLILPYLDAINIDYKGSGSDIYEEYCLGHSEHVLENISYLFQQGVHVEVTTLIVPGVNDSIEQITRIVNDIAGISKDIPWHISRFFPAYKMKDLKPTPIETLYNAKRIGQHVGLTKIYLGNI